MQNTALKCGWLSSLIGTRLATPSPPTPLELLATPSRELLATSSRSTPSSYYYSQLFQDLHPLNCPCVLVREFFADLVGLRANFFFGLNFDYEAPRSKVGIFTKRLGQRSVYTRSASTIVWKVLMLHTDSGS